MKLAATAIIILLAAANLGAQYQMKDIVLPDSAGGMTDSAYSCVFNEKNNCLYVGGKDYVIVIEGATDRRITRIPVPGIVTEMLWVGSENKVFCAQYGDGKVTVLDASTNTVASSVFVGSGPVSLAYNETDNVVYCANRHSRNIAVIDAVTNAVDTLLAFDDEPVDLVWNATTNRLWCAGGNYYREYPGSGWYADSANYTSIAWDSIDNKMYIADSARNQIKVLGRSPVAVGEGPVALAWNPAGNKLYCANHLSRDISVIDCGPDTLITVIPLSSFPQSLYVDPDGNRVYCLGDVYRHGYPKEITVIDGAADTVVTLLPFGQDRPRHPYRQQSEFAVNHQGNKFYCTEPWITRAYDSVADTLISTIRLGTRPIMLTWNAATGKLYSIEQYGFTVIGGSTFLPVTTRSDKILATGEGAAAGVWNAGEFYIKKYNVVVVIDGNTDQVVDSIYVGPSYPAIALNAIGNKIYVPGFNGSNNVVQVIDASTHTIVASIPTGGTYTTLAWNGTNNKIYCGAENGVLVVDGFSDTVIDTIEGIPAASQLLWNSTTNTLWVTGHPSTWVVDGVMDTVVTSLRNSFYGMSWNSTNNKMYFQTTTRILVVDGWNHQVIDTIPTPVAMCAFWNSGDNRLYVAYNKSSGFGIFVVDGPSDSVIADFTLQGSLNAFSYDAPMFTSNPEGNKVFFAVERESKIIMLDRTVTGISSDPSGGIPGELTLRQNYPNPFNPVTSIRFDLPVYGQATLRIVNILGEEVATLVSAPFPAGSHTVTWNAQGAATGIYFCRLEAGGTMITKKMVLIR